MKIRFFIIAAILLLSLQNTKAQDIDAVGSYTPYSFYGVGDLAHSGTSMNKAMGGIGVAVRDIGYVNPLNIASVTQRDTLSFMLNVGLLNKNIYLKDAAHTSAFNTANINNLTVSFPLKNKTAMMIGVSPYSNIGYKFRSYETNPSLVSTYGDIQYKKYGHGSIDQIFVGVGTILFKGFSFGIEGIYYFGGLNYESDIYFNSTLSMRTLQSGWKRKTTGWSAEAGLQYSYSLPDDYTLILGATYRMKSNIRGELNRYAYAIGTTTTDTISEVKSRSKIVVPSKFAIGATFSKSEKWMVGIDYERQDWSKTEFLATPGVNFSSQTAQSFRLGVEYIPNKYDVRYYFKRVTYRAGFHYDQSYVKFEGKSVNGYGVTFGMSFPISRLNTTLNFSVDAGKRGRNSGNLILERYINFVFSFNLHDIWFVKRKYD